MVSADNLNLDVLELIFAHLNRHDLAATALVNKFFLVGVVPKLYSTLSFRIHNAKRYPTVSTSFAAVLAHPSIAIHVRTIDIRVTPLLNNKVHPTFVNECTRVLELCKNLRSFVYTPSSSTINAILPMLQDKEFLKDLRISAKLSMIQANTLAKLKRVEKVELDNASWEVLDVLPGWAQAVQKTLTSLTLYMSMDLNFEVLEMALKELPRLKGLHILCPNIDHPKVLRLVSHTPLLESLAFNVTETAQAPDLPSPPPMLDHLRHLAIDVRSSLSANPSSSVALLAVLAFLKAGFAAITSATLKIPELTSEANHAFILKLIDNHASTLRHLVLVDAFVETRTIRAVSERCPMLEVLSMPLPMKEILSFASALSTSSNLHTLIEGNGHVTHGVQPSLNQGNVTLLMQRVPTLSRIIHDRRLWTGQRDARGNVRVALERQPAESSVQWFLPPY